MMTKRITKILSLLLAIVLVLASCSAKTPVTPDEPVTAEGIFANFLGFNAEETKPLNNATLLDEYGTLYDWTDEFAVFYKVTKDRMNNLTETYTFYSVEERKAVGTVTNTYFDEWGWTDKYGNETHAPKEITDCEILMKHDIVYFVIEWTEYDPIDEEIIESEIEKQYKEQIEDHVHYGDYAPSDIVINVPSYIETSYYEFYDITGKLIASSRVADRGDYETSGEYYTVIEFGKTVGVFDNETGELVYTYDGDKEATPLMFDYMNDNYNYLLDVPYGVTDPYLAGTRKVIEVYDKDGNLVLLYAHGDYVDYVEATVLESGDILIQQMTKTDSLDYDAYLDGIQYTLDTFILDVETGVVTEIADFDYRIENIVLPDDVPEEFTLTENVRNIAHATRNADGTDCIIFFDNFGNVNFVYEGKFAYEMLKDAVVKVLDKDHILVELASGVSERAIIGKDGNVIAYLPNDAIVLEDFVVTYDEDARIYVYDFDMKNVDTFYNNWLDNYDEGSVEFECALGNTLYFTAEKTVNETDNTYTRDYVIALDVKNDEIRHISDCIICDYSDSYVLVRKTGDNFANPVYLVYSASGRTVLAVRAYYIVDIVSVDDETLFVVCYTEDGVVFYLVDNTGEIIPDYDGGDYDGDKDDGYDDGDKDGDGGDEDGDDEDEGGEE